MTDNRETIEMLKMLKKQALKSHNDTAVLEVKIDSFNFVLDEAIKALEEKPCENSISREEAPATPKKKTGWHIAHGMLEDRFWCSCGFIQVMDSNVIEWKYCPLCGGERMQEVEK